MLEKTLNRIQKSVRNSNLNETDGFTVSLSVGGVIAKNETAQEAAYRADRLMYRAKSKKNAVVTEQNQFAYNGGECYGSAQKILIADDWELNRKMLCDMIGNDFEILEARDGRECMELIGEYGTEISLILLDDIMPGTDGFEILAEMNRLHYIDDIPVIMIMSNGTDDNIRRAFSLGVSDYISRPFDPKVVKQRIQNTLRLHQRRKVKDFFIKFKKKSHFANFFTKHTLDFVLHRLLGGLAEMHTHDIGCLADLLSHSRARGTVGCGIVHSKSSCK